MSEPVRVYCYSVVGAIVAALVVFGVVTGDQAVALMGVGAAVLAVPAVEAARSQVTPVRRPVARRRAARRRGA